jgi:D-3-phosphoglycerate dehydrogenase
MRLLIAEDREFSPEALARLRDVMTVETGDLDREQLLARVAPCDALWVRLRTRIDRAVFDAAPSLRLIVTNTTGLDHIDLDEAARRGIEVVSLRGEPEFLSTVTATAELTLALALGLLRHIPAAVDHVRGGGWDRYPFKGHDLFGKTAGIVGYGRLGRLVARYLLAFGMRVVAATPQPCDPQPGVSIHPLDDVLRLADIVTLHVNLTEDTRGMIGARELALVKRGAWLVNTARGELVVEAALLEALESGRLAGAAVDVVCDTYANDRMSPLRAYAASHDNLIATPHIGGYTFESLEKTELFLAEKVIHHVLAPAAQEQTWTR